MKLEIAAQGMGIEVDDTMGKGKANRRNFWREM